MQDLFKRWRHRVANAGYQIAINPNANHEVTVHMVWRWDWVLKRDSKDDDLLGATCADGAEFSFTLPLKQHTSIELSHECANARNLEKLATLAVNHLTASPRFRQIATTDEAVKEQAPPAITVSSATPVFAAPSLNAAPSGRPRPTGGLETSGKLGSTPTQPAAYAVIVGVQTYQDGLPASEGAASDAESFRGLVKKSLGIPDSQVRSLIDDSATKANVERALDWARNSVPRGGRIYFYFAGHGAPDPAGA